MRFYRNNDIEALASTRLSELSSRLGRPPAPPIPIDLIAEHCLGLDFLWEEIEELPGETILGALSPETRRIILNERHRGLFAEKPGLERSTRGHEMGHWDLYLSRQGLDHPGLFDRESDPGRLYRRSGIGQVVVLKALLALSGGWELFRKLQSRADDPDEARAVNRYAAALSMPAELIRTEAVKIDRTRWSNLYQLAARFDVTISGLRVRLEQLDLLAVGEDGRTLYGSKAEALGQTVLF